MVRQSSKVGMSVYSVVCNEKRRKKAKKTMHASEEPKQITRNLGEDRGGEEERENRVMGKSNT